MAFHQELNIALILRNSVSLRHWVESIGWSFHAWQMQSEVAISFAVAGAVLLGLCGRLAANGVRNIHVLTAQGARGVGVRWQRGLAGALLLGAFLGAWVGARHGASVYALCLLGALGVLVMLAIIDAFTGLLPDELTLPLLWLGLLLSWLGISPVSLHQSVGGAVVGYGFLWLLALVFFWVRGKEGMGHGDFKLTAAMGAWLGYGILPFVLLLACALGVLVVFFRYFSKRALYADYVGEPGSVWAQTLPFGPYLVVSGVAALLVF